MIRFEKIHLIMSSIIQHNSRGLFLFLFSFIILNHIKIIDSNLWDRTDDLSVSKRRNTVTFIQEH